MDPLPPLKNASAAARERILRNRERIAKAEAEALGLSPSSTQGSLPPSTTFGSIALSSSTSSGSGSGSGSGYPLLGLPDPLTPLGSIYPKSTADQTPPGFSSLGLSTESPIGGYRFGGGGSIESPKSTPTIAERKAALGPAIGIEDEFDFDNEIIIPEESILPPPAPSFVDTVNISRWSSTDAGSNTDSVPKPPSTTGGRFRKWDPHAPRAPKEGKGTFVVIKPEELGKDKKKEEREGMMGRIFGRKGKGKGKEPIGKEVPHWEEQLEAVKRAELEQDALRRFPTSSSQPSSSRTPRQPNESSPHLPISQTTPSLISNPFADPRPSPATQFSQLSSNPSQPRTPREEDKGLPPVPSRYQAGMTPRQGRLADNSPSSHTGPLPMGWEELAAEPLGQPLPTYPSGKVEDSWRSNPLFANTVVKEVASPERPPRPPPVATRSSEILTQPPIVQQPLSQTSGGLITTSSRPLVQNQESRYPPLSPNMGLLPSSMSLPSISPYLSLPPDGFDPNRRRPSDNTIHAPIPDQEDIITQNPRRRSMSMTGIDDTPRYIVDPKTRYVPRRRTRTGDSADSDFTTNSLSSLTRESLGVSGPSTDIVRRMSKMITVPIYGVPSTPGPGGLPPPRRRRPQVQATQQVSRDQPALLEKEGFFTRHAGLFTISTKPKKEDTYHEHFDSLDPIHPEVSFFMNPYGPEGYLDTYFPPGSPKHLLSQLFPSAPSTLGRINNVVKLQSTVWIRLHPRPSEEGAGGIKASTKSKMRPGTGGGMTSGIKPFGKNRPGTSTGQSDIPPPLPMSGLYGSEEDHYPAVWKRMDLVLTSFTYDGTPKDKGGNNSKKLKYHTRGTSTGPERTVAHLHLFDPTPETPAFGSKAPLMVKRPKTSDTFGASATFGPDGEIMECQRRPLTFGVKVVNGQVVDLGDRRQMESDTRTEMENRTRKGVVWFGWGVKEGWFVQFTDPGVIDSWLKTVREILRRMGRELLTLQSRDLDRVLVYKREREHHTASLEAAIERLRTPEEHISYYLSSGHSIWDNRTNPNLRIPSPGVSPPKLSRWAKYEHPDMKAYRERDKLETFDQLSFGRVGWREWVWPVPPDKVKIGSGKSIKRAQGRRNREKKLKLSQARRIEGARRIIPESSRRATRESTLSTLASNASLLESQLGSSTLPYLSPPLRSSPRGVHHTPSPPRNDDMPNIYPVAQASPLRPLLLASKSNRSLASSAPRSISERSIATISSGSTASLRPSASASNTALGSTPSFQGPGSIHTVRSTNTFDPTTRTRPGTGGSGRNIPLPPSLPPPSIPIPPTPTSRSPSGVSQRSRTVSEGDKTPRRNVIDKFPTPPQNTTPTNSPPTPSTPSSKPKSKPPSSFPSGMIATPTSTPTQPSTPPQSTRGTGTPMTSTPTGFAWAYEAPTPTPGSGERGRELGMGSMGESTASLVSDGADSSFTGTTSGSLLSVSVAGGRRRRIRTVAAVDLAGEIKEIDDAKLAEIRAAEAAAADVEEPIDESRSRKIRFA